MDPTDFVIDPGLRQSLVGTTLRHWNINMLGDPLFTTLAASVWQLCSHCQGINRQNGLVNNSHNKTCRHGIDFQHPNGRRTGYWTFPRKDFSLRYV